jgi:hypothetical protein
VGRRGRDLGHARIDRGAVPRFTDTGAVNLARRIGLHREGRRHDDDLDILRRIDARRSKPVAQDIIVARITMDDR